MRFCARFCVSAVFICAMTCCALGLPSLDDVCPRVAIGRQVPEPAEIRSANVFLRAEFAYRKFVDSDGFTRYCYVDKDGRQSPTLRVKPGDQVTITQSNELRASGGHAAHSMSVSGNGVRAGCPMTAASTNLHFRGIEIPPLCHQDDTLKTLVEPSEDPFE